ncbi:MAG: hypothetical protein A3F84_25820 [Candidatus Handelsmanbacteria bacterium RIFCSPLOWO2_12_FULL_64_10]|uniref:DUF6922 domain-containing protein n=1 Tax=Handelsmanbacteria sp. (strain RIFCSPLOWO2_12_FULL_64_10) TaxID=1817868 RepID=A0A1F6C4E4_HANXR|nr:MAG: hypothetical protein A3F84_25820 [Candidatus Handelsmanbacteria bacterium RIFCSPLOWO2_12_FULL_64_10]
MKSQSVNMAGMPKLPKHLKSVFWDYDFDRLRWKKDRDLIIARVLASGDWKSIQWLRRRAGSESLQQWIIDHRGRGLTPRQLRFWELVLDLPHQQVKAWLKEKERDGWHRRATP